MDQHKFFTINKDTKIKTYLNDESLLKVQEISMTIGEKIKDSLNKKNYGEVRKNIDYLRRLVELENSQITDSFHITK